MKRNDDEEKDIDIPRDEDENVGAEGTRKKKKHKSKEERVAERKIIFWTLIVILIITVGFWLMPKIRLIFRSNSPEINIEDSQTNIKSEQKKMKNIEGKKYVEIIL